ncbi:MAG: NifB/NifX family molybdenum-iron cluster-binding protein [Thermodesulfobacteriota bacterium]|nr:NifB/NifX family molybdenum-iron cluster-binding protein [Thermodesulfobacteriota bacterium]
MKIAFPTQENNGIESTVHDHFGSARFFIIVDSETGDSKTISNQDINHTHNNCQPLLAIGNNRVDAVVTGGIGAGAISKLTEAGIISYRAVEGTVSENLKLINSGKLPKFSLDHTCTGHSINGECVH